MIKQNLHTHSIYDDGTDTIDEMAKEAIEKGFTILGYSGHGYNHPLDEGSMTKEGHEKYCKDVLEARDRYADKLQIYCGIEQDSFSRLDCTPYDYVIGSVHFLQPEGCDPTPIDYSRECFENLLKTGYDNDIQAMVQDYYQDVADMIETMDEIDIIGHIDLISKYNEEQTYFGFEEPWYLEAAKKAIDKGIEKGKVFEMNTGAISRGYRKTPYPHQSLLQYMADHQAKLCINTDCHGRKNLDLQIDHCIDLAKQAGFQQLYAMTPEGLKPFSIDDFRG